MRRLSCWRVWLLTIGLGLAAVPMTGCDIVWSLLSSDGSPESSMSVGGGADRNQKVRHKLNPFVGDCENSLKRELRRGWQDYKEWAGSGEKFQASSADDVGNFPSLSSKKYCIKAIDKTLDREPAMEELDSKLESLKSSIKKLVDVHEPAKKYYERENYKDDGLKKARNLHKKLAPRFQNTVETFDKTVDLVDSIRDKIEKQKLERLKNADGKQLEYQQEKLMRASEEFAEVARKASHEADGREIKLKHPNVDKFKKALKSYKKTHDAFSEQLDSASKEKKEKLFHDAGAFREKAENLRQKGLEMRRALESGKTFDRSGSVLQPSLTSPEGSLGALIYARNELVSAYNDAIRFR